MTIDGAARSRRRRTTTSRSRSPASRTRRSPVRRGSLCPIQQLTAARAGIDEHPSCHPLARTRPTAHPPRALAHACAGLVTIAMLLITVAYNFSPTGSSGAERVEVTRLRWGPTTHVQFWFAMLGGSMAFMHYFFLLKAFEGAPSTVLLPLVQVASVSVLVGSSVVSLVRNEPWITPTQGLAYVLMFVGGILPSCGGQLSALLERSFWRQSFVYFAILAEFSLGLHDLMLSGCAYDSKRSAEDAEAAAASEEPAESTEFFVWSRVSFVLTFIGMYLLSPKLYTQLRDLLSGRVATKYIGLSAISEGLTILGFYLASIAYGLFSQVGRRPKP